MDINSVIDVSEIIKKILKGDIIWLEDLKHLA
jgi:hypothetical protein